MLLSQITQSAGGGGVPLLAMVTASHDPPWQGNRDVAQHWIDWLVHCRFYLETAWLAEGMDMAGH
jgi:hypothetical protein